MRTEDSTREPEEGQKPSEETGAQDGLDRRTVLKTGALLGAAAVLTHRALEAQGRRTRGAPWRLTRRARKRSLHAGDDFFACGVLRDRTAPGARAWCGWNERTLIVALTHPAFADLGAARSAAGVFRSTQTRAAHTLGVWSQSGGKRRIPIVDQEGIRLA